MSPCHVKTLLGPDRSHYTVTSLWSDKLVAGFGLFATEFMADLLGLSVLQGLGHEICAETVPLQLTLPADSDANDTASQETSQ